MKRQNLVVSAPGELSLVTEDVPDLPEGELLLETVTTGLSAGTELTFVKGDHPSLSQSHDTELGLFQASSQPPRYPVTRLGYMEVARVARSRTPAFAEGDLVASAYGHATAHVSDPVREHVVPLPEGLDPVLGVYVAHVGPICANGLLNAAADALGPPVARLGAGVEGRRVLITGAGLIGLLTGLFAREYGAEEVAVVDADPRRRAVAESLGSCWTSLGAAVTCCPLCSSSTGSAQAKPVIELPSQFPIVQDIVQEQADDGVQHENRVDARRAERDDDSS